MLYLHNKKLKHHEHDMEDIFKWVFSQCNNVCLYNQGQEEPGCIG